MPRVGFSCLEEQRIPPMILEAVSGFVLALDFAGEVE
jgi:hypothetical protein